MAAYPRTPKGVLAFLDLRVFQKPLSDPNLPERVKQAIRYTRLHFAQHTSYDESVFAFWNPQGYEKGKRVWRELKRHGYDGFEDVSAEFNALFPALHLPSRHA